MFDPFRPSWPVLGVVVLVGQALLPLAYGESVEVSPVIELEPITVDPEPFSRIDDFSIVSVDFVQEGDIQRLAQSTLGETLAWQPGVSSSYFGPGASRPVIRGLGGFRVRLLQDGVGTLDVSETSPDHGVTLEPLLIREIDIHRGPSALLFGNAAIGGAIDATTRQMPEVRPESPLTGSIETRYESAGEGRSAAGYAHLTAADMVLTLTGSARSSDDYAIPERARTEAYERTFVPLINDPAQGTTIAVENPTGTLPNTSHRSDQWSVGVAWLPPERPYAVTGAYTRFSSDYGIPYQYGGDANDLFGDSSLSLRHERFDTDARYWPELAWLNTLRVHLAYADYHHTEHFTGRGKDADKAFDDTRFDQHALEARVEWFHQPREGVEGVVGIHVQQQALAASFLSAPPLAGSRFSHRFETGNLGLFALETFTRGDFMLQIGGRYETQSIRDTSLEEQGFTTQTGGSSYSLAGSLTWRKRELGALDELVITPAVSFVGRIPTATERFAFWPNPAIQRFLIGGDKDGTELSNEQSLGVELGVEARMGVWSGRLNAFRYSYDNFIFLQDVKGIGNPARYVEREATFQGFEGELSWRVAPGNASLTLTLMSDYVYGQNVTDDQPLPRMPPLRLGAGVRLEWRELQAGLEYRHAFAQTRVQPATDTVLPELSTGSYTELNADLSYDVFVEDSRLTLFMRATNLLNEERRLHTSFIKDVAPLPGRSISFGVRSSF